MYGGCDYYDPQDVNPIQGRIDGQPQTAINCPEVAAMGGSSSNNLEDNLRLSNFSLEDLSKTNPPSEGGMGIDLQQQLRFDLEQEYNSHLMQDMLQDSHSQLEHRNWEQEMQEMDIHQQQQQQQMPLPHDLQCFNSAAYLNPPYTTPDLLNLLHLPRCSVTSMLPASSIAFNSPERKHSNFHTLDMYSELPMTDSTSASTILYDPPLQLSFPPQPPIFRDLFHSLPPLDYSLPGSRGGPYLGGVDDRDGNGGVFQEGDGRQFDNSLLDFRREMPGLGKGEARGTGQFATERQRREQLSEKFKALGSLVPNPTKTDRASVVSNAIDYIKELQRSINELKILVEKKRCARERRKRLKVEDDASNEIESSSVTADREQSFNGSLRSSWLLRKSKETMVDVRIVEDEVNIKLTQRKKASFMLLVAKILDELQLELLQVAGGNIGDYYIFMFNTKIGEDSSVYASAIANKMIEVLDRQHLTFPAKL